jgi:hypothetical protein
MDRFHRHGVCGQLASDLASFEQFLSADHPK